MTVKNLFQNYQNELIYISNLIFKIFNITLEGFSSKIKEKSNLFLNYQIMKVTYITKPPIIYRNRLHLKNPQYINKDFLFLNSFNYIILIKFFLNFYIRSFDI